MDIPNNSAEGTPFGLENCKTSEYVPVVVLVVILQSLAVSMNLLHAISLCAIDGIKKKKFFYVLLSIGAGAIFLSTALITATFGAI